MKRSTEQLGKKMFEAKNPFARQENSRACFSSLSLNI